MTFRILDLAILAFYLGQHKSRYFGSRDWENQQIYCTLNENFVINSNIEYVPWKDILVLKNTLLFIDH